MIGGVASTFAKNKAANIRDAVSDSMSKVDWEDYNYPPFIQVKAVTHTHYLLSLRRKAL